MSANNYIFINRKTFKVEHRDYDTDKVIEVVGQGKSLNEAINIAQKFMKEETVEYGIYFE